MKKFNIVKAFKKDNITYPSFTSNDREINVVKYRWSYKDRNVSFVTFKTLAPKEKIVKVTDKEMFCHLVQLHILKIQLEDIKSKIAKLSVQITNINNNNSKMDEEKELLKKTLLEEKDFLLDVDITIRMFVHNHVNEYSVDDDIAKLIASAEMNTVITICPLSQVENIKDIFNLSFKKSFLGLCEKDEANLLELMREFKKTLIGNAGVSQYAQFNITKETACTSSMRLSIFNRDVIQCIQNIYKPDNKCMKTPIADGYGKKADRIMQNAINYFITQRLYSRICGEDKNLSFEHPKKEIQIEDNHFIVRTNLFKCCKNHSHSLEEVIGLLKIITPTGTELIEKVPCAYCKDCNCFYMLESEYQRVSAKGDILCETKTYEEYCNMEILDTSNWSSESILKHNGYNVQANNNLSDEQRQAILQNIMNNNILSAHGIVSYIDTFIAQKRGLPQYRNAVMKWEKDKEFVLNYNNQAKRQVEIEKISRTERKYKID